MKTKPLIPLVLSCLVLCAGCTRSSDVEIRNPLIAGAVDASTIVKTHTRTEDHFGLPRNALSDEAWLVSVDASTICIGLTLRETDPISFNEMEAKLTASTGASAAPNDVHQEPVTATAHEGRVPMQQQTGESYSCTKRDDVGNCLAWSAEPTYATTYVPGTVEVHEARGRVCFPNNGIVTKATTQLTLEVEVRRRAPRDGNQNPWAAFGGSGTGEKDVTFRWGFQAGSGRATAAAKPREAAQTTTAQIEADEAEAQEPAEPEEEPSVAEVPATPKAPAKSVPSPKAPPKAPPKRSPRPNTIVQEPAGAWEQRDAVR
jgi:hypothetical protein